MDQKEEFERYERHGEFPRKEPREPLSEDGLDITGEGMEPILRALHIPKAPLTNEKLKNFLIELKPEIKEIQHLSRNDQHKLAARLQDVKNLIHNSDLSKDIATIFEKMVSHFNNLLVHSAPLDQKSILAKIEELEKALED